MEIILGSAFWDARATLFLFLAQWFISEIGFLLINITSLD